MAATRGATASQPVLTSLWSPLCRAAGSNTTTNASFPLPQYKPVRISATEPHVPDLGGGRFDWDAELPGALPNRPGHLPST